MHAKLSQPIMNKFFPALHFKLQDTAEASQFRAKLLAVATGGSIVTLDRASIIWEMSPTLLNPIPIVAFRHAQN